MTKVIEGSAPESDEEGFGNQGVAMLAENAGECNHYLLKMWLTGVATKVWQY